MQISAQQIAALIGGTVEGNPQAMVSRLDKIEEASEGSFCFLGNPKYEDYLYQSNASVVLVKNDWQPTQEVSATLIRVADVYSSFAKLLDYYQQLTAQAKKAGIEEAAFVHPSVKMGEGVYVGAHTYISEGVQLEDGVQIMPGCFVGTNCRIGRDTVLHAGVKIYHNCQVGEHVIIHCGTVIGSDGFGFAQQADGSYKKIPQMGNVIIENDVEIGANCTIDRATMGSTRIGQGVKMDNLIQIAHNVEIGSHTVIAAQCGISGSTKVGSGVVFGGQVGTVGHITIANGTKVNGQSGISKSIETPNTAVTGSPAFEYKNAIKSQVIFRNLPELQQQVKQLEQQLLQLKEAMNP